MMSREKLLTISVIVLLVLNVGIVGFLLLGHKPDRPPAPGKGLSDILIRELKFDPAQEEAYIKLRESHKDQMEYLNQHFTETLRAYMMTLERDSAVMERDSLANKLAFIERQKATITMKHFQLVRNLCHDEQLQRFDGLIPEIARFMSRPPNPGPPQGPMPGRRPPR